MKKLLFAVLFAVSAVALADFSVASSTTQWQRLELVSLPDGGVLVSAICASVLKNDGGVADQGCVLTQQTLGPAGASAVNSIGSTRAADVTANRGW